MKRLQFLLSLPAAAIGMTTKPTLSRAARDKAEEFGVPLVLGGQKLQKVFSHKNWPTVGAIFFFEDFEVKVSRYLEQKGEWIPVTITSLVNTAEAFHSAHNKEPKEVVGEAFKKFCDYQAAYKQI